MSRYKEIFHYLVLILVVETIMILTIYLIHMRLSSIHTLCGMCETCLGVWLMYLRLGILVYPFVAEPL